MRENQKRVNVYIPTDLYVLCTQSGYSLTEAIIKGLELVLTPQEAANNTKDKSDLLELQEARIRELQEQINVKENQIDGKENNELQQARIDDLKIQIQALYGQMSIKDEQLHTKDEQIEKLNENMHKQAVHIQSLIQENSRLNIKLLPDNTEKSKPWWRFW
jgi:DNA repair exonuclease SbcCD ATPase subunit